MSPEFAGIFLAFLGLLLKLFDNEVKSKKRHDKLKNDTIADKAAKLKRDDENDTRRDKMLNSFTVQFNSDNAELRRKVDAQSKEITASLVSNARLEGQIDILIKNQEADRTKISVLSQRITELESDGKFKDSLIIELTKERDETKARYEDSNNRVVALTLELSELEAKLVSANGVKAIEAAITTPTQEIATSASNIALPNVQTADQADNLIDNKKDNE